ncbi:Polymyxin resistance protein ArnT, undecaprenyl phosphate-alpha-L-Ara4N transferase [Labilithrix luteola]|uniref:Polymyxin resistance protein ArnT, undecaprenyl phosphate-alpha-L-Ara4N transferase n=1 Tax=Labilithrix luteola TaxID=1391654 RepID=A0A0K1QEV2_9BACT|nr:glycosyltransferase family 39 protein [Labilithrix luteola]AKV04243.1 Polymyxin resistance protein ArnT, undecaprenyl phosphate-alpha-L-Ara4N transferase [Labilithrix luteola]
MSETKSTDVKDEGDATTLEAPSKAATPTRADKASAHEDKPAPHDPEGDDEDDGDDDVASPSRAAAEGEGKSDEDEGAELLPRGNPLRVKRGLIALLGGAIPAFLLMAKNTQNAWGIPVGFLFVAIAAFGVMDLLGSFDDETQPTTSTTLANLRGPIARTIALVAAFAGSLAAAQAGFGPWWVGSITVTGTFLGLVASLFAVGRSLGPWAKDELGEERPLLQRHGFWVVAIGALLYFPAMGLQSLWDPWETHYGEVAREILSRDDWVSLWWAQDGWFWSKPILNFWIQSLAMGTLGTHFQPDQMLIGAGGLPVAHPEWVVRTPNVLMTIGAMYLLYKGVAKVFGRRAGLLGGLVLATMPDWFFLAHQTMTDMPFVASMTAAMGLLLYGLNVDEDARVKVYELEAFGMKLRLSLWHLVFGAVLICAIPQILYLLSRNLELVLAGDQKGFRLHWDEFRSGSAGNCGLPGNEACASHSPASVPKSVGANPDGIGPSFIRYFAGFEPSLQGIAWAAIIGGLLYLNWGERRTRRIVYVAAWLCAAIATMAKGPAGVGLPVICAFAYVATKKRWSELLRLELLSGLLVILAVALPWYIAMYVRHGPPFTDRIIIHDMFNRAFSHVHDTNEGDDTGLRYYVWQLGYALFPWTGLAPLALVWGFRRSDSALSRATNGRGTGTALAVGDASVMLVMWFLFAYALFTFMGTKFHHYIFPAVPPVAMLVGVVLDDILGDEPLAKIGKLPFYVVGLGLSTAIATWGAMRFWSGSMFGRGGLDASPPVAIGVTVLGLVGIGVVVKMFGRRATAGITTDQLVEEGGSPYRGGIVSVDEEAKQRRFHEQLMIGAAAVLAAVVVALVGRDLSIKPDGSDQPGAIRLLQLFTYNYKRAWPDSLDFGAVLGGFTAIAAILSIAAGARSIRRHAIAAFCAFSIVWAAWGLDVYMVAMSPHWGQHELIEAYYRDRQSPDDQLIAYQMNWKGENFYTSNKIPAFVSTGATYQNWLKAQKEKGVKVIYLITEHSRLNGMRSETGAKSYKELTDKALCNKFVVVRAEF